MYLSRIEIDTDKPIVQRVLNSPHMLHAAIERCFPDDEKGRKLWRLDRLGGRLYLLLLSPSIPGFKPLAEQYCPESVTGESKPYLPFLANIKENQKWRFRLQANPTHSEYVSGGKRGKVYAHVTVKQQEGWLLKKATACGFDLNEQQFFVAQNDVLRFTRQGKSVTLGVTVFEGVLTVTNVELFRNTLISGIGRAKAYGCGLLTIMPL